jgi:hypothetical protein
MAWLAFPNQASFSSTAQPYQNQQFQYPTDSHVLSSKGLVLHKMA